MPAGLWKGLKALEKGLTRLPESADAKMQFFYSNVTNISILAPLPIVSTKSGERAPHRERFSLEGALGPKSVLRGQDTNYLFVTPVFHF